MRNVTGKNHQAERFRTISACAYSWANQIRHFQSRTTTIIGARNGARFLRTRASDVGAPAKWQQRKDITRYAQCRKGNPMPGNPTLKPGEFHWIRARHSATWSITDGAYVFVNSYGSVAKLDLFLLRVKDAVIGPRFFPPITCLNESCNKVWIPRKESGAMRCPRCQRRVK